MPLRNTTHQYSANNFVVSWSAQGDAKTPTNGMVNSWLKTVTSNAEFEKPVTTHAFRHFALHVVFRKGECTCHLVFGT